MCRCRRPRGGAGSGAQEATQLQLLSGALVQVRRLRRNALEAHVQVDLELLDGRLDVDVPRKLPGQQVAPVRVRTPVSVAGVRGTQFSVQYDAQAHTSQVEVRRGTVASRGQADAQAQLLGAEQGAVVAADGRSAPPEALLPAPQWLGEGPAAAAAPQAVTLRFGVPSAVSQRADHYAFSVSDTGNVHAPPQRSESRVGELALPSLGKEAAFVDVLAVSPSGLQGLERSFAVCRSYRFAMRPVCDLAFDARDLKQATLFLHRLADGASSPTPQNLLLTLRPETAGMTQLKSTPEGRYAWRMSYQSETGQLFAKQGFFEVVALQ